MIDFALEPDRYISLEAEFAQAYFHGDFSKYFQNLPGLSDPDNPSDVRLPLESLAEAAEYLRITALIK